MLNCSSLEQSFFELDTYQQLKATYTEEEWPTAWPELYQRLQKKRGYVDSLAAILDEENQLDQLFRLIRSQEHGAIPLFKKYAQRLSTAFPEETVATYVRAIDIEMRQTGRSVYEKAIQDMKTLATLPGGQPAMQELLQRLRLEYRNRKAMLQLFDKAFGKH
ncbi:MAG: hypothetical protein R3E95_11280 [Thiolinea sp.]